MITYLTTAHYEHNFLYMYMYGQMAEPTIIDGVIFSLSLSLSLSPPPPHTHAYAHTRILCRRKDHTLSQPVCEVQHQSCSLFRSSRLCNVVVRKTLIFGAAESALLHHRTILIVTMAFSIFTFHDKIFILHANDFSGKKKKELSLTVVLV